MSNINYVAAFEKAMESIDIDSLPSVDQMQRHLEGIEHSLKSHRPDPTCRSSATFEVRLLFGDSTVLNNHVVGYITIWQNLALEASPHLMSHPTWAAMVQQLQFEILCNHFEQA